MSFADFFQHLMHGIRLENTKNASGHLILLKNNVPDDKLIETVNKLSNLQLLIFFITNIFVLKSTSLC